MKLWKNLFGLRCAVGMCPCRPYSDDGGCAGQCVICGKIVGYTSRAAIRAYMDAEERAQTTTE